jgi:seryl-tRNA synthetase
MTLQNTMDNCDDEIEEWEALEEKLIDGKTVYAPVVKTRKRKRSPSSTDSGDEDEDRYSDEPSNKSQSSDHGPSLTAEDIETKSQELKDQKKEARLGRTKIEAEIKELKTKIKDFEAEIRSIEDNRSRICISARNQYSKSAIQVDFAAGIKEVTHPLQDHPCEID